MEEDGDGSGFGKEKGLGVDAGLGALEEGRMDVGVDLKEVEEDGGMIGEEGEQEELEENVIEEEEPDLSEARSAKSQIDEVNPKPKLETPIKETLPEPEDPKKDQENSQDAEPPSDPYALEKVVSEIGDLNQESPEKPLREAPIGTELYNN